MKTTIQILIGIALVAAIGWFAVPSVRQKIDPKVDKFVKDADSLIEGLQQYREFVGSFPSGSTIDIAKALTGQTDKKVLILAARKSELNAKGEIVDPWGTPLQIFFSNNGILIRSAGPNRVFEDSKSRSSDDLFRSS